MKLSKCLFSGFVTLAYALAASSPVWAGAGWSGNLAAQASYFPQDALYANQHDTYLSLAFEPEYYHAWMDGDLAFTFEPFARLDQYDDERSHADIRELQLSRVIGDWEWRVGVSKVFWGVTESQHLVDVINQTDLVEGIDQEQKLGQPMIYASWIKGWGVTDFFVLPGFRERTFPAEQGRLRPPLIIDVDNPVYESSREQRHVDYALRWSHTLGDWDVALAYFNGTARAPVLTPSLNAAGEPVLTPVYNQSQQLSLSVQAIIDSWILKLEALRREGTDIDSTDAVGGFEYTLVGIFGSALDLGVLMEYNYDNRGRDALTAFQNDLFAGARLTFNDVQSSDLLAGVFYDLDYHTASVRVEASRRLGASWKLTGELQTFNAGDANDLGYALRDDDYLKAELAWYF